MSPALTATVISSRSTRSSGRQGRVALFADVLGPELGSSGDELAHQSHTLRVVAHVDLDAARPEVVLLRSAIVCVLADHHTGDAIEQDRPAAHVARHERRIERCARIVRGPQTPRPLEAIHLGVQHGAPLLYSTVVSAPNDAAVDHENGACGNATLAKPFAGFVESGIEKWVGFVGICDGQAVKFVVRHHALLNHYPYWCFGGALRYTDHPLFSGECRRGRPSELRSQL